tara:strand:- start:566 stop:1240 length:675 start_codon:yes stop_codon:yes gene_type:complete
MREDEWGHIVPGGMLRYTFYMTNIIIITTIMSCNEIYLLQHYKKQSQVIRNNSVVILPYIIFIISSIITIIVGRYSKGSYLEIWFEYLSYACVAIVACMTLLRTCMRGLMSKNTLKITRQQYLLPLTHILTFSSTIMFLYTDVPRLYDIHISLTFMAAVSSIVFLDVRGICHLSSVALLMYIYTAFIIQVAGDLYAYQKVLIETSAFTGFFICYSLHVRSITGN